MEFGVSFPALKAVYKMLCRGAALTASLFRGGKTKILGHQKGDLRSRLGFSLEGQRTAHPFRYTYVPQDDITANDVLQI